MSGGMSARGISKQPPVQLPSLWIGARFRHFLQVVVPGCRRLDRDDRRELDGIGSRPDRRVLAAAPLRRARHVSDGQHHRPGDDVAGGRAGLPGVHPETGRASCGRGPAGSPFPTAPCDEYQNQLCGHQETIENRPCSPPSREPGLHFEGTPVGSRHELTPACDHGCRHGAAGFL